MAVKSLVFSGFLGLAPAGTSRTNLQFGESYHLADATAINPLTTIGILAPGLAPGTNLDAGGAAAARIAKMISTDQAGAQRFIMIEEGAKIHAVDSDGANFNASLNNGYPVTITATGTHAAHTDFVASDILAARLPSAERVYISYNDSNDGDIMEMDCVGGSIDYDWFSTQTGGVALNNKVPHPMVLGENGYMYVADANAIHKFDGDADVVTPSAIDLPRDWIIQDMIPYKGYIWILARKARSGGVVYPPSATANSINSQAGVFLWNYQSRKSSEFSGFEKGTPYLLDLVSRAVSIFIYEGVPHVLILGSNKRTQLRRFTGSSFQVVHEEPGDILPVRGGVATYFNNILWADRATGALYTYGRVSRNMPETFNKIGATGAATGAIALAPDGKIWASYGTSSIKMMDGMYLTASATTLTKHLPKLSTIKRVTVYFQPISDTTASNSLTISTYKNFSTSAISKTMVATHAADLSRGWVTFQCGTEDWRNFNACSFKLDWANTAGITSTFNPYRIEVEYEVEDKIK